MRTNIKTQMQRQIGSNTERSNGAQMLRALCWLYSLSIERLSRFVWFVLQAIKSLGTPNGAGANPKGIARLVTLHQTMDVDASGKVPSSGTDQAIRSGLIAG